MAENGVCEAAWGFCSEAVSLNAINHAEKQTKCHKNAASLALRTITENIYETSGTFVAVWSSIFAAESFMRIVCYMWPLTAILVKLIMC